MKFHAIPSRRYRRPRREYPKPWKRAICVVIGHDMSGMHFNGREHVPCCNRCGKVRR